MSTSRWSLIPKWCAISWRTVWADLAREPLRVVAVEPLERPAVDRDLVRHRAGVADPAARQRNALVEPEIRRPAGRLVLDHDRDVRHLRPNVVREPVDRGLDEVGERVGVVVGHTTVLAVALGLTGERVFV